jgi:beta-galactosidase
MRLSAFRLSAFIFAAVLLGAPLAHAQGDLGTSGLPATVAPVEVLPDAAPALRQSLNGDWQFKYLPQTDVGTDAEFFQPVFDVRTWKSIPVPSHWELQGFAEPKYAAPVEGTGLYRRMFQVPAAWQGRRVFLRFDGVLYGFQAWVNGRKIGAWASGYNPATFDITDALAPTGDNVLAVQVSTRTKGWEFDTNDCWGLSGIYRDVTLFSTPTAFLADVTAVSTLRPPGEARLRVAVRIGGVRTTPLAVRATLRGCSAAGVEEFVVPVGTDGSGEAELAIPHPALWTAETPALYALELALVADVQTLQRHTERIGLRQVTIDGAVLKLNGTPVKLRGVDHHDLWPEVGRAAREEDLRRDLELIKAANCNFIRTSHYPPHPRLLELCDELGLYVMDEVPFGFGDEHLTDPSYGDILLTRARATVMRDKNRPSVIVWSVGNENPITDIGLAAGKRVKELDPTRPICFPQVGSYFQRSYPQLPAWVDIYAPHYPVAETLRTYAATLTRPTIVTEYAHALGLATDRIQDEWDIMAASPTLAGGAVWMFQDQGILRTAEHRIDRDQATNYVWLDSRHDYDTNNLDGCDGLVYSDRTPQVDYWQVRKTYSPVWIPETSAAVKSGANDVALHVENRYDFRDLAGLKLAWSVLENGAVRATGARPLAARPKQSVAVTVPVSISAKAQGSVWTLALRCLDERGVSLYERTVRLNLAGAPDLLRQFRAGRPAGKVELKENQDTVRVSVPQFSLAITRATGAVTVTDASGQATSLDLAIHLGRRFTMAETLRSRRVPLWPRETAANQKCELVDATKVAEGIRLRFRVSAARPDAPEQSIAGEHTLLVRTDGTIDVSYDYRPLKAVGTLLEAGIAFRTTASEFRWIGQGPYAGYPGKDRLNEFGLHHLNREDLYFSGNRRGMECAVASTPDGRGFALLGTAADVAVEATDSGFFVSHNALLSGRGNKGVGPESPVNADKIERITGHFTLVPLGPEWPEPLLRWFGAPDLAVPVLKPFYRSYDQ